MHYTQYGQLIIPPVYMMVKPPIVKPCALKVPPFLWEGFH